jgi:hypothetical protein
VVRASCGEQAGLATYQLFAPIAVGVPHHPLPELPVPPRRAREDRLALRALRLDPQRAGASRPGAAGRRIERSGQWHSPMRSLSREGGGEGAANSVRRTARASSFVHGLCG